MMKLLKPLLLTIFACCGALQSTLALNLPFEVEETLLDLLGTKDVSKIDKRFIVPIYRKDLDASYIAYYEFNYHKNLSNSHQRFIVLSAGPKTKDYQIVESGPTPSPTQVLVKQAKQAGQKCHKFFRLNSMGLYMCENEKGRAVAASFDWIADAPVQNWRNLEKMMNESMRDFKEGWKDIAKSAKDEWKTMKRKKGKQGPDAAYDAELVSPGSTANVALEKKHKKISIHAIPEKRQQELCAILVDVCKDSSTNVNSKRIHKVKRSGIRYLQFQVNEDKKKVRKILQDKEISFYFKIETPDGEQLLKYFSVDLSFQRKRSWSSWRYWSIPKEYLFPDYNQHKCCGCYSGCGPVAWAQILGYYDRLAHYSPSSGFSRRFWTCSDGSSSGRCVAPRVMSFDVKRYILGVRRKLGTFCLFGGGATKPSQMKNIIKWYRARGIGGRIYRHYHTFSWLGWTKNWIRNRAATHVKSGYPAIVGIWVKTKKKAMHYAVATRYTERYRKYRKCFLFFCSTKTAWQKHFYLHMGWGGYGNAWYTIRAFAAFAARKYYG